MSSTPLLTALVVCSLLSGCFAVTECPPMAPSSTEAAPVDGILEVRFSEEPQARRPLSVEIVLVNADDEPLTFGAGSLRFVLEPVASRDCDVRERGVAWEGPAQTVDPQEEHSLGMMEAAGLTVPSRGEYVLHVSFMPGGWTEAQAWRGVVGFTVA